MSAKIMGEVWELDLPHNEQSVLLAMADHADHEGESVRPSVGLIAWKTGYDERTVRRIQKSLKERGLLVTVDVRRAQNLPTIYRIDTSAAPKKLPYEDWREQNRPSTPPGKTPGAPPGNSSGTPRAICPDPPDIAVPGPSGHPAPGPPGIATPDEPSVKPSVKEEAEAATAAPADFAPLIQEAAKGWMGAIADEHAVVTSIELEPKRRTFRAGLNSLIKGSNAIAWQDKTGRPVPWHLRPRLWELALDQLALEGGRIDNILRFSVIPRQLDAFPQRQASEAPAAGSEAARILADPRNEKPGRRHSSEPSPERLELMKKSIEEFERKNMKLSPA